MQDGFHAQPMILAEGSNGWQTISGTEDVGLNLDLEGIGQRRGRRGFGSTGVSAGRRMGVSECEDRVGCEQQLWRVR